MRVLHVSPAEFGENGIVGGAERYALELARHMASKTPTTLAVFGDRKEERRFGQLVVRTVGPARYVKGQRSNPVSAGLLSEIRQADVVHCHQQHVLASTLASLMCRLTGRRVYVSDLGGGGWDVSAYISTDRWYHGHLHISEYSRFVYGHRDKPWAHVIYGGVDTAKFSPHPSVPKNGTILFVGRLLPHKGVEHLIEAMPEDMTLEVIGRAYHAEYQQHLLERSRNRRVIFRHECSDEELIEAYRRSLCIVLPSVYRTMYGEHTSVPELLGQTLLEGMACGTPAICTRVASMPEVVRDGVTGFVVEPNDPGSLREKIVWLRENAAGAGEMGALARKHVLDTFTWEDVVRRCLKIYSA